VDGIVREEDGIRIKAGGQEHLFDAVVVAAHADEALAMLDTPTEEEQRLLSKWRYTENRVLLHRDASCLPPIHKARASWNYVREADLDAQPVLTMSYYMNQLQQLSTSTTFCVTLNPQRTIDPGHVAADLVYSHPHFSADAVASQPELKALNGRNNTWFCGSYFRYGFHEDAVESAVSVAEDFGIAF
jgi:predicted NAD/FAD-binding protein